MQNRIDELTYKIIGCAMEVHSTIGNGFQEFIYQKALAIEMNFHSISFEMEKEMHILYRNIKIGTRRVDFFVEEQVMVEIKAVEKLEGVHKAQAINYLEVSNMTDGLLINFGGISLEFKRLFNKNKILGLRDEQDLFPRT
ncbi:MAG: GxxExxY protein [Ignavibacteria bacterium]